MKMPDKLWTLEERSKVSIDLRSKIKKKRWKRGQKAEWKDRGVCWGKYRSEKDKLS